MGKPEVVVDSSILTFANHGCNGQYNIGEVTEFNEFTANTEVMPENVRGKKSSKFSPVIDRHLFHHSIQAIKDMSAGDEILDNYIVFTSDEEDWAADVVALRNECSGAAGEVLRYERNLDK